MLRVEHSTESATSTLNSDIQGVNAAGTAGDSSVSCIPPPVTTDAHIRGDLAAEAVEDADVLLHFQFISPCISDTNFRDCADWRI